VQELGGRTARQIAKLANGNIPYLRRRAQFINGDWPKGQESFLSHLCEFKSSLFQEFKFFQKFSLFLEFCEIHKIRKFGIC